MTVTHAIPAAALMVLAPIRIILTYVTMETVVLSMIIVLEAPAMGAVPWFVLIPLLVKPAAPVLTERACLPILTVCAVTIIPVQDLMYVKQAPAKEAHL